MSLSLVSLVVGHITSLWSLPEISSLYDPKEVAQAMQDAMSTNWLSWLITGAIAGLLWLLIWKGWSVGRWMLAGIYAAAFVSLVPLVFKNQTQSAAFQGVLVLKHLAHLAVVFMLFLPSSSQWFRDMAALKRHRKIQSKAARHGRGNSPTARKPGPIVWAMWICLASLLASHINYFFALPAILAPHDPKEVALVMPYVMSSYWWSVLGGSAMVGACWLLIWKSWSLGRWMLAGVYADSIVRVVPAFFENQALGAAILGVSALSHLANLVAVFLLFLPSSSKWFRDMSATKRQLKLQSKSAQRGPGDSPPGRDP